MRSMRRRLSSMTWIPSSTPRKQLSVHVSPLVRQSSVCANQFHFDLALIAGLDLISGGIKENILLSEVLRDLGECAEQVSLGRRKDQLTSGLLAQFAQVLIIAVFN